MRALLDSDTMHSRILLTKICVAKLVHASGTTACFVEAPRLFETKQELVCPQLTNLEPSTEYYPWTHLPQCIEAPDEGDGLPETFCLYTRAVPGSERGFSIITTKELAREFELKDAISNQELDIKSVYIDNETALYETRGTKFRGIATFATHDIKAGQVIFTDSPLFITLRAALHDLPREERHVLQWRGVLQLSKKAQNRIRSLTTSRGGDEIDDALQTNAIGVSMGDEPSPYLALMPKAAVC